MGDIVDRALATFREYETEGLPASGPHRPVKAEVRDLFGRVETAIAAVQLANAVDVHFVTKAAMEADTAQADGAMALVWGDATAANNGYYNWDDGAGQWERNSALDPTTAIAAAREAALDALEAREDQAIAAINARRDEALGEMGAASLIDSVPSICGFDEGWYVTDMNGYVAPDGFRGNSGVVGVAVRQKVPGADWSGLGGIRVYDNTDWYIAPTFFLSPASVASSGGRHMANEFSDTPPSDNLFTLCTGDIRNTTSGVSLTKQFDLGPTGEPPNSAVRGAHGSTTAAFRPLFSAIPANGGVAWDITMQVKGTVAGTTSIKKGAASALASASVTDSAWSAIERASGGIVSDGSTAIDFQVRGDGSNTPTLLYDQLQGYPLGERPDWDDEMADTPFNWHFKKPLSYTGAITVDANGEIVMTGGVNFGYLLPPSFPEPTVLDDDLFHTVTDITAGSTIGRILGTEAASDLSPPTTASSLFIGTDTTDARLATAPVNTGPAGANIIMKDAGVMVVSYKAGTGHRGPYVDGVPVNVLNTSGSNLPVRLLQLFGTSAGAGAPDGTALGIGGRHGQSPTGPDIVADVKKLIRVNQDRWDEGGTRNKFYYSGDSNLAPGFPAGSGGPSCFYSQGEYGYHSRPLMTINKALSGSSIERMTKRWNFAGGQPGADSVGVAPTWYYSDHDAVAMGVQCGNNMIYGFNVSFPNDLGRFNPGADVTALGDEILALAEAAWEVTGNPTVILGATGLQTTTSGQLAARDTLMQRLSDESGYSGILILVDTRPLSVYTYSSADFYDDKHLRGSTVGVGQNVLRGPVHDTIAPILQA